MIMKEISMTTRDMKAVQLLPCLAAFLMSSPATAATYYVNNGSGSGCTDSGVGSLGQPFCTIQRAATVAFGGDVVQMREGVYRETVTPNSGTTFTNYGGESVTISGADPVSGWARYNGS